MDATSISEPIIFCGFTATQIIAIISIFSTLMISLVTTIFNARSEKRRDERAIDERYINIFSKYQVERLNRISTVVSAYLSVVSWTLSLKTIEPEQLHTVIEKSAEVTLCFDRMGKADSVMVTLIDMMNHCLAKPIDEREEQSVFSRFTLLKWFFRLYMKIEFEEAQYKAIKGAKSYFNFESCFTSYVDQNIDFIKTKQAEAEMDILTLLGIIGN